VRTVRCVADVGWSAQTVNSGGSNFETSLEINSRGNMRSRGGWEIATGNMFSFLRVEWTKESRYVGKGKTFVSISL